jgi:hypothetical protein
MSWLKNGNFLLTVFMVGDIEVTIVWAVSQQAQDKLLLAFWQFWPNFHIRLTEKQKKKKKKKKKNLKNKVFEIHLPITGYCQISKWQKLRLSFQHPNILTAQMILPTMFWEPSSMHKNLVIRGNLCEAVFNIKWNAPTSWLDCQTF